MATVETMAGLSAPARDAVRDLILVLADSKRLLGMRYAEWILGAPELEAGIACASMAQDEWGHARLFYALLKDFGEDVDALEHGREPGGYASMEALDEPAEEWVRLVVLNALVDAALSVQCEALRGSTYAPLAQRVGKVLEEERYHAAHGVAWFRRLAASSDAARSALAAAVGAVVPGILAWFGPDSERARLVREAGVVDAAGGTLRERYLGRLEPLLELLGERGEALRAGAPALPGFDEARRRTEPAGPDAATVARIRGDRNRPFLLD